MVVTSRPSVAASGNEEERTGSPSMWTVHAARRAIPQPNLVPVRRSCSRSTQRRGVSGSASTWRGSPLTLNLCIAPPAGWTHEAETQAVARQRQGAEAPAAGREDRIYEGGSHGDGARLPDPTQILSPLPELGDAVGGPREG